jgi:hypothetical protein
MNGVTVGGAEKVLAVEAGGYPPLFIERFTHGRCESYGSPAIPVLRNAFDTLTIRIYGYCAPYVQHPILPVDVFRLETDLLTGPQSRSESEVEVWPPMRREVVAKPLLFFNREGKKFLSRVFFLQAFKTEKGIEISGPPAFF